MRFSLSFIFILAALSLRGQTFSDDHLEPVKNRNDYKGVLKDYYDSLDIKLLTGLSDKPLARYMVIPYSAPEYVLSVEKVGTDKYVLKCQSMSSSFYYSKNRQGLKANLKEINIKKELALLANELFEIAISQTNKPATRRDFNDGVTYYFSVYDTTKGLITGKKISPEKNSKIYDLTVLMEKYRQLVLKNKITDAELISETEKVIKRLK